MLTNLEKYSIIYNCRRGVAQLGRALRSGRRGREFESRHLDQKARFIINLAFFLYKIKTYLKNVKGETIVKILVIGCPGAGKSTFARKLHDKTHLPLYYLDRIWHKPDKTNVSPEEFDTCLKTILAQNQWIIDGNYLRTLEMRIAACDKIFFLNYPVDICLNGVQERLGKPREDMPWIETEFDLEFQKWITDFPKEQLPKINALLKKYQADKDIIVFHSRKESEEYLKKLH